MSLRGQPFYTRKRARQTSSRCDDNVISAQTIGEKWLLQTNIWCWAQASKYKAETHF